MDQLQQVRKLGSMKSLLGMIPGMAQHRKELEQFDEKEIDRTEAIIRSMTPEERRNPKIIDGSRRARIAYGSGVTVSAVNGLLQRFEQAAKMMKRMSNKAMGGIPRFRRPRGRRRQEGQGQEQEEGLEVRQSDEARGRGEGVARQARRQGLRFRQVRRSAFMKKPQNPALPAGLQDALDANGGELPPNFGGGLSGLLG